MDIARRDEARGGIGAKGRRVADELSRRNRKRNYESERGRGSEMRTDRESGREAEGVGRRRVDSIFNHTANVLRRISV